MERLNDPFFNKFLSIALAKHYAEMYEKLTLSSDVPQNRFLHGFQLHMLGILLSSQDTNQPIACISQA